MGRVISGDRTISIEHLNERAARAASGFSSLGIQTGDSIALFMRNDFAFFEVGIAAGLVGAYPVPVNWHFQAEEAAYVFRDSNAKAIVVHTDLLPQIESALPPGVPVLLVETPEEIREAYGIDSTACEYPPKSSGWLDQWRHWLTQFEPIQADDAQAPGSMIYTSGTTGNPKGVRRNRPTPEQAIKAFELNKAMYGLEDNLTTVMSGPMYHSAPNNFGARCIKTGGTVVLLPRFDAEQLLQVIERERVSHLFLVPVMFIRLLKLSADIKNKYDISSLKFVVHAAAPCPTHVKKQMIDWWGPIINEYYGATETGGISFCNSEDWLKCPGTVGKILPDVDIRFLDESGQTVADGEVGEIYTHIKGMADFVYQGDASKRQSIEIDGRISAGDMGYLNDEGFLFISDRRKDMVISGGVNIYPTEIEFELLKLDGIHDCAVFGIPDEEYGESLCGVIELDKGAALTADEVKAFLRGHLAGYKIPKIVEFQETLPREDSGKIFKRKLREPYWQKAGRNI